MLPPLGFLLFPRRMGKSTVVTCAGRRQRLLRIRPGGQRQTGLLSNLALTNLKMSILPRGCRTVVG